METILAPTSSATLRSVELATPTDLEGFRRACRVLTAEGVSPEHVTWQVASDADVDLFAASEGDVATSPSQPASSGAEPSRLRVPAAFLALCETVILHRDPERFALLYRLLWRLQHESGLRHDPLDPDRLEAERCAAGVRRDLHKMKAFVRFRRIDPVSPATPIALERAAAIDPMERGAAADDAGEHGIVHVAWFEPEHHIVEAVAPFFARRFAQMRWAILTPDRCVQWDGERLAFTAGVPKDRAPPADAGEQLWLTYYRSIFNPARLKLKMMQKEMPKRYWKNLPEAELIEPLAAEADQRSAEMIDKPPEAPAKRRPRAAAPVPIAAFSGVEPPASLVELHEATERCRECQIGEHATQAVGGAGPVRARLMLVGEQPGDQEDLRGQPFVGPAGQLLGRALEQLGWDRDAVYVTNAVKHFKYELRGKRRIHKTPSQQEAAACLHWLEREIELVDPEGLVALGATAARSLMHAPVAVMKERGRWLTRPDGRRVLITLHPSALLRTDPNDRDAAYELWLEDLKQALDLAPKLGTK